MHSVCNFWPPLGGVCMDPIKRKGMYDKIEVVATFLVFDPLYAPNAGAQFF